MHGKCPRCEKVLSHVNVSDIKITAGFRQATEYVGVSFACPFCNTVISVSLDPGPLKGA